MRTVCVWLMLCDLLPAIAADEFTSSDTGSARPADAQSATSKPAPRKPTAGPAKSLVMTPEREATATVFVKQHHPELAELLIHLKDSSPKEYERAIRDLYRASERLAQVQERDSQAYELELNLWKARSRAQLLNARLQMADDEEVRRQLRAAVTEAYDLRLQILSRERDKFAEKAKNLENQIERLTQRREEAIENQLQQLTKAAPKSDVKVKSTAKKKSAAKPDVAN